MDERKKDAVLDAVFLLIVGLGLGMLLWSAYMLAMSIGEAVF